MFEANRAEELASATADQHVDFGGVERIIAALTCYRIPAKFDAAAWLRAKVGLFLIEVQMQQQGDVYEMVVRVTYRPLPPMPEVVYERQEPDRLKRKLSSPLFLG
jgi:hypothetical protein